MFYNTTIKFVVFMPLTIHDYLPINSFKCVATSPRITALSVLGMGACAYFFCGMSKSLLLSGAVLAANLYMRYQDEWITPQNFNERLDSLRLDLTDSFNENAFEARKSRLIRRYDSLQGALKSVQDQTTEFTDRVEKLSMIRDLIVSDSTEGKNWNDLALHVESLERQVERAIREERYLDEKEDLIEKYQKFQAKAAAFPERFAHFPGMKRQLDSLSRTLNYSYGLPKTFRETLSYWGRASNAVRFEARVKESGAATLEIVNNLLLSHEGEWGANDLFYLVRVQNYLRGIKLESAPIEKIISMLREVKKPETFEEAESLETAMNLSLLKGGMAITSERLAHFIHNSSRDEMGDFVEMLETTRQQNHRRNAALIQTFFLHANSQDQARFFAEIRKMRNPDVLFGHVILALPREISELNFSSYALLNDRHILLLMDKRFRHLRSLDISNSALITDAGVQMIASHSWMASLNRLVLGGSENITDLSIENLSKSSPMQGLTHLSCISCNKLTDSALVSLSRSPYLRLQGLHFHDCWFYDKGVEALLESEGMKNLKEIAFTLCRRLSSRALKAVAESPHMSNLEKIDFSKTSGVSDSGLIAVSESPHLSKLRKLYVSSCGLLTDESFERVAQSISMRNLEELRARTCYQLTDRTPQALASSPYMGNLVLVDFGECPDLTNQSLLAFYQNPRKLKDFSFYAYGSISAGAAKALRSKLATKT